MKNRVELDLDAVGMGRVVLCGKDISGITEAITVNARLGDLTRVTLELSGVEVTGVVEAEVDEEGCT